MRIFRAGDTVEDRCRACKIDRLHTIIVVTSGGAPLRVQCDYCGSQHQFRGGPGDSASAATAPSAVSRAPASRPALPLVSERERVGEPVMIDPNPSESGGDRTDLELLLRRIIREEAGVTAVAPAEKWRGGTLVLKPANTSLQERTWPIDTLFHKVVMIRNRLRTLEQVVNASDLPDDVKLKLQGYISGCYGSLTSFNVLFADEADHFKGAGE